MNKRELIEHINNTLFDNLKDTLFTEPTFSITENAKDNKVAITVETEQGGVLVGGMLKKFKKVTIPQFVADWYEEQKDDFETNLFRAVDLIPSCYEEGKLSDFEEWLVDEHTKPFQTLVNMHQFGYEVEKEKRYTVKVKNLRTLFCYLAYIPDEGYWTLMSSGWGSIVIKHTRKEIEKAGFGEVFNSPLFEIEEVEE